LASAWNEIGQRAESSLSTFNDAMKRATDEGMWKGASRNAVAKAVGDYSTRAVQLANAAKLTGNKVTELGTGLEPTKALVPHAPEHRSGVANARHWIAGRGWRDDSDAEDTAHAEAVRVLRTVYTPVIHETDTNVPVIPKPDNPTSNPGDSPTPGPGGTGGGNGGGGNSGNGGGTNNPTTEDPTKSTETTPSTTQSTDPSTSTTPTSSTASDQSTKPDTTSTNPSSATTPGTAGRAGTGGSTPGTGGSSNSPSPGRTVSGAPAGTASSAGGTTARTAAATAGRSGASGMGAPGKGGKDDEGSGKSIPDYLINQENGEELTGLNNAPKTVPPVIGE
jgi:hypothetical protein